jgi:hypothetical protein
MAMDINAIFYNNSNIYQEKTERGLKYAEEDAQTVNNAMEEFQKSPESDRSDEWKKILKKQFHEQKEKSNKRWDNMYAYGVEKIGQLPPQMQEEAVTIHRLFECHRRSDYKGYLSIG